MEQEFSWFFGNVEGNIPPLSAGGLPEDHARNWVAGGRLTDDTSGSWNRVSLPGYVFKKRRYWIDETSSSLNLPKQTAPPVVSVKRSEVSQPRPLVTDFKTTQAKAPSQTVNGVRHPVKPVGNTKTIQPALAPEEILNRVEQGELEVTKARAMLRSMRSSN